MIYGKSPYNLVNLVFIRKLFSLTYYLWKIIKTTQPIIGYITIIPHQSLADNRYFVSAIALTIPPYLLESACNLC